MALGRGPWDAARAASRLRVPEALGSPHGRGSGEGCPWGWGGGTAVGTEWPCLRECCMGCWPRGLGGSGMQDPRAGPPSTILPHPSTHHRGQNKPPKGLQDKSPCQERPQRSFGAPQSRGTPPRSCASSWGSSGVGGLVSHGHLGAPSRDQAGQGTAARGRQQTPLPSLHRSCSSPSARPGGHRFTQTATCLQKDFIKLRNYANHPHN